MEADPRTLPTWVTEWRWREVDDEPDGNVNYGRTGGRVDGSRHVERVSTRDQRFDAIVSPLRGEMPCPTCGRQMGEAA
jgi:hypothetical protein